MVHLYAADGVAALADDLARVLATPLPDPFAPDWVAVPTHGLERWLRIALARHLGAGADAGGVPTGDGVTANIEMPFPGALRTAVLEAGRAAVGGDQPDPWQIDRLVWAVAQVLHDHADDPRLAPVATLAPGATHHGRARRIADLFDRYAMHRPAMVRAWAAGRDLDGAQHELAPHDRWQPHLWRLVRARVQTPSAPEVLPDLLAEVARGGVPLDLPPRLALFGLTTLPGGAPFLDVLRAVAAQHEVHLFLLVPSPGLAAQVRDAVQRELLLPGPLRSDDPTPDAVVHPLLQSWARPTREALVLLTAASARRLTPAVPVQLEPGRVARGGPAGTARSLLTQVQHDLRAAVAPAGRFVPAPDDQSIRIHSCHGPARQVDVMRDAILHALADDPTLREDDIVVLCPAIDQYAPLIEAAFGTPAGRDAGPLSYRLTDRSLRDPSSVLGALGAMVDLVGGRFRASAVLDFLALPAVRLRFGFTEDELARVSAWAEELDVRWGIDGEHRARWGIPDGFGAGTWRAALDRLVVGVAVTEDDDLLAVGQVLPFAVEGEDIDLVGRVAALLDRLGSLAETATRPLPLAQWCAALACATDELLDAPRDEPWQRAEVMELLEAIRDEAGVAVATAGLPLTLADVRRLLTERLRGSPRRPDFFRGGVTISSLTPLRGVPFRVVGLLGLDESAFGAVGADGDDLIAASPHIGDRDARAEVRQSLLEALAVAEDRVIITRTGHNLVTNLEVPPAVPIAELRDVVLATVAPDHRAQVRGSLEVVHPRQPFDERNFQQGALIPGRPFSFDAVALEGAGARRTAAADRSPFLRTPLSVPAPTVIDLADLQQFLRHPVRHFLRHQLQLRLPESSEPPSDDLSVTLAGLPRWKVADRVIDGALAGRRGRGWVAHELARGSLPAGVLGEREIAEVAETVAALVDAAEGLGYQPGRARPFAVDIGLPDGTRVVGAVNDAALDRPGPLRVTFSRQNPKHTVASWLDLMAVVAAEPARPWHAVSITRRTRDKRDADGLPMIALQVLAPVGAVPAERRAQAIEALAVAVDLYRRAQHEPLPLFASLSHALVEGSASAAQWRADGPFGHADGDDPANAAVFGHLTLRELEAVPAQPHDPPGRADGRALRFAEVLWDAIDRSTILSGPDEEGAP